MPTSGNTAIVGMGSIGGALAVALVAADCNKVVFFGRRPDSNPEVFSSLFFPFSIELNSDVRSSRNFQVFLLAREASTLIATPSRCLRPSALKLALSDINMQFGRVKNIVHTAAVINDASTSVAGFENVVHPKVIQVGSWNLHVASQNLNFALELFVLFSSTK